MGNISSSTAEREFGSLLQIITSPEEFKEKMKAWEEAKEAAESAQAEAAEVAKANVSFASELTDRESSVARREAICDEREKVLKGNEDALIAKIATWKSLLPQLSELLR